MPHLTVEFSKNLSQIQPDLLKYLNVVLVDSGLFVEKDIKSRLHAFEHFLIGLSHEQDAFVHVKLAILSGRDIAIKKELSHRLLSALQSAYAWPENLKIQLCVEIQEIELDVYAKISLN